MSQELRFLLAISLMILVLVGTNIMFPPVPQEELLPIPGDSAAASVDPAGDTAIDDALERGPAIPESSITAPPAEPAEAAPEIPSVPEEEILVSGPLYTYVFSNYGARIKSIVLPGFQSFARPGAVELLPPGESAFGAKVGLGDDVVDLAQFPFEPSASSVTMAAGSGPHTLSFRYEHPTQPFAYEVAYTFDPSSYLIAVETEVSGLDRALLVTDLGLGIAYNEAKPVEETRSMGYVVNHTQDGIRAVLHNKVDEPNHEVGPLLWAAVKSKYFVIAVLAGGEDETDVFLGGLTATPAGGDDHSHVQVTQPVGNDGTARYRLYAGPQSFDGLTELGDDMEDVNPYGWRLFRPIIKPFVGIVMFVLTGLHSGLSLGYGWVLIVFGVAMRIVLFPLNHKAMRAQMRNMAVQPLLQDIQKRYKDNPERLQKEMMKLYKEHGFNPLAGCLPMLLPWPVLITLFFVFQNTIELRGVPFLWLPSLSGPDPFYVLPLILGLSMFLMQWINIRVTPNPNAQLKMMMWIFPIMFTFIFLNLASGLNLYYATANLATLPQQIWLAKERAKVKPLQPAPSGD